MTSRVFVYGTLKEGFPNFGRNSGTRLPGVFVTKQCYPVYLVGEHHSSWLINSPGNGLNVSGQVFEVSADALAMMDVLERINEQDGYERIQIAVRSAAADVQDEFSAFAYLKHPRHLGGAQIKVGPLSEVTLEHAALYRKRVA